MDLGNGVEINFGKLSDEQLQATRAEVETAGVERGLWVPEGAGRIAVVGTVEISGDVRDQLLASVEEGATLFNGAVESINAGRRKAKRIPITPAGEYRERAEDWLTDERVEAAEQLPVATKRPLLVIPRLSQPISHEELVNSWKSAANGQLWGWSGRMEFLKNWTADELSGYDPEADDAGRLTIIPTAYDEDRRGTVAGQKANLETLQADFPQIGVARIFDGAVIARRYMRDRDNDSNRTWQDTYVRAIDLEPTRVDVDDCVPGACVDDGGYADVDDSNVRNDTAARLQVR